MPSEKPDRQARHLAAGRLAHFVGDDLAELEDLLGAREGGLAGLGQGHAAARRLQQLVAQGASPARAPGR
jgi:hypothetical protein